MNYKKLIKKNSTRVSILHLFDWVPDSIMLRFQYWIKLGFWPHFSHPRRFTEKLQLYKMKYRNPVLHECVDKFTVRAYVQSKGLSYTLAKLYGVYSAPNEIDFSVLPEKFVIKSTSGGGGREVIIVRDKNKCNWDEIECKTQEWVSKRIPRVSLGREWAYTGIYRSRIIIEELLDDWDSDDKGLIDYKFFCFDGEPKYLYVIADRVPGEFAYLAMYDMEFNKLPYYTSDERRLERSVQKPHNFELMVDVAKKLSSDFPHVRVDLYNLKGRVVFGELTFYDGSGYYRFEPDDFDFIAGSFFTEYN